VSVAAKGLAAVALVCAALVSAAPWFSSRQDASATGSALPESKPPAPAPSPVAEVASANRTKNAPSDVDHSRELELPDGSFVPALNGAVGATRLAEYWGPLPWSPIVAVERSSAGIDWFRHQDGSYSTTQMVWRKDLGRYEAMTRVAHPGPAPAPVAAR
jgi:hypothetical protein